MRRRQLLATLAPLLAPAEPKNGKLKIRSVDFIRLEGKKDTETGVHKQHQVNPLHVYEELRPKEYADSPNPGHALQKQSALYLQITTDQGVNGLYGPIDKDAAIVVEGRLKPFLIGKDPLAGEALWDQLFRLDRHSRSSHFMMAISAVDNTLWDLRGRYFETPVYRLLGGPTREKVTCYGSCLGYSLEPERVRERTRQVKAAGFLHQKWFMGWGPSHGAVGLRKNIELVKNLREAGGDDVEYMFDAFQGWDLNYAIQWAKAVEPYRPRWIEEAFHVDKMESFAALRRATSVPVATGEHFYGRWEVERYLKSEAITVVQSDPEWCGGVSELVKTAALCSAHDAHLIPHGHSIHSSLHVIASQSPMTCPLVECLILKMQSYYWFEKNPPLPVNGQITLSTRPGFGIEFDPAKVEKQETIKLLV